MKALLNELFECKTLDSKRAGEVLAMITKGEANPSQMAAFMTVFLMRPITVEELKGFRETLLNLCLEVKLEGDTIDLCGTGGDAKNTFNISTLSSFVVASMGLRVAKHGNYGVSSVSGSSNVMEHLGYVFTTDHSVLNKQLDKAGICFLHAPLFHPALKKVAPVRTELGVKTFFNMLGPLVNPARPKYQSTGVFNLELARVYKYLLEQTDRKFTVCYGLDGYDEVSLTCDTKIFTPEKENLLTPADLGSEKLDPGSIKGGATASASAELFKRIIEGKGTTAQNSVVAANAGLAFHCVHPEKSLLECIDLARENLISGKAGRVLKKLVDH